MTDPLARVMRARLALEKKKAIRKVIRCYAEVRRIYHKLPPRAERGTEEYHGVAMDYQKAVHKFNLAKVDASKFGADLRLFPDYIATHNN